jgi:acylphosphatase
MKMNKGLRIAMVAAVLLAARTGFCEQETGKTAAAVNAAPQGEQIATNVPPVSTKTQKRIHVFISGKVQGVGFRAFVSREVNTFKLNVTGWVRNLPDGRVELVAEGPSADLGRLMTEVAKGPAASRVDAIEQKEAAYTGEFKRFAIEP